MAGETDSQKIARLEREIETLKSENERLRRMLEEALRAAKRQAAPFSRRQPKAHPQKPGRKAGKFVFGGMVEATVQEGRPIIDHA